MASMRITRRISLTPELDKFVRLLVESGRHRSASEVVHHGLRLLEQHAAVEFRADVELGYQQVVRGEVVDGPSVFAEIRRRSRDRRNDGADDRR